MGNHHSGKESHEEFHRRGSYKDSKFYHDYVERLVETFDHQIQYEYYGGNVFVSMELISLENYYSQQVFLAADIYTKPKMHAAFDPFLSYNRNMMLQLYMQRVNK